MAMIAMTTSNSMGGSRAGVSSCPYTSVVELPDLIAEVRTVRHEVRSNALGPEREHQLRVVRPQYREGLGRPAAAIEPPLPLLSGGWGGMQGKQDE